MAASKGSSGGFLSFAKSSLVFFVGSTLSKVITIALLPLYTNVLPSADYGYFDVSVTCVTLLTSFLYCDVWTSVMRFMRDDLEGEGPKVVTASGWVVFGCSTALYYVIGIAAGSILDIPSLGLILLYGTFLNLQTMFSYIARGWGDNVRFAVSGIISSAVNVGLNLVLILVLGWGYEALYVAFVAGSLAQCLYLFVSLRMWKRLARPRASKVRELFLYSAPLCLNSVAYWLLNSLGRVVVSFALSLSASGIFAVGSRFGSAINLATSCFTYAWQDIAFTSERKPGSYFSRAVTQYTVFLMDALVVMLPAISLVFPVLVGSDYSEAYAVVPSFLAVAVISAISTFIGNIFYVIRDTKTIGKTMAVSCLVNVALTYPLTVSVGLNGTNLAIALAFLVNIAIRLAVLRRRISMRVEWHLVAGRLALMALSVGVYAVNIPLVTVIGLVVALSFEAWAYKDKVSALIGAAAGVLKGKKRS